MPAAASGGVQPLNVQIRITTSGARAAASSMANVTRASQGMSRGMSAGVISARTLGDAMRMSASLMKYTVAGAFMNIGKQSIQMSRQFELAFSRIKGLVVIGTGQIEMMKKAVLEMATETARGPIELADALYYITSAGIKEATTALEVLNASAKAATAGLGETNTVADAVTSTLNAYGAENISAAKATDILVATVREGKAEADTFAPALGKVLPVAAAFGASFEDVSAAIAALSRGGLSAGTAAIYIRQTLSQLLKPSKQAQEVLKSVGTSAADIRKQVQDEGLFPALITLRDQLKGIENASDFTKVFGNVRALTAVLSLVGPAAEENAEIFERMNNSGGDLDVAFGAAAETLDFKFNKALAAQQSALIAVGDSLKPIIAGLLDLATVVTKAFAGFFSNPIGKWFTTFAAGATIAVAVVATMLKTGSALVRLFANMNITLTGTQYQYNAVTKQMYVMTAAQRQQAAATAHQTMVTNGYAVAQGRAAKAMMFTAKAGRFMMASLGWISLIAAGIALLGPLLTRGRKQTESLADSMSNLGTVMDETVKTARSGITVDVEVNYKTNKEQLRLDALKKEIQEQVPDLQKNLEEVAGLGENVAATYGKSIMLTLFADRSDEDKLIIQKYFADVLNVDPQTLADAAIPNVTGNAIADSFAYQALTAAADSNKVLERNFFGKIDPSQGIQGYTQILSKALAVEGSQLDWDMYVGNATKDFGKSFTKGIQDTGEISPLIGVLDSVRTGLADAGVGIEKQGYVLNDIVSGALSGLTGDYDVKGDKSGNLAKIFADKANLGAITEIVEATIGTEDTTIVTSAIKQINEALKGVPTDTVEGGAMAVEKISYWLNEYKKQADKSGDETESLEGKIADIAGKFEGGYAPAIGAVIDAFEDASNAIKDFEKGQRAVMGLAMNQTEATIGFRDSLRDLAEASNESGGALLGTGEKADQAKGALLDSAQSLLDVTNAIAATGDIEGAAETFSSGMAEIIAAASSQGMDPTEVMGFLADHNITADQMMETLKNEQEALGNKGSEVGQAITNGVNRGIQSGIPALQQAVGGASKAVIDAFKQFLAISSPSKRMAKEIGKPMADGVVVGFSQTMSKNRSMLTKSLDNAIMSAAKKGGRKGLSKYLSDFMEKKENVETPAQDFVKESISRIKDIIGSLGDYINKQLSFRKAQADLAKLINMQRGLDDRRKRAAREQQYAETRFGAGGGAEVTGYEQARLDQLQLDFERVSRDYAMGRATYVDLVDAEIALNEARASASEVSDDVIDAQNKFVDATVDVENRQLELSAATVDVLDAYTEVQEAAANLYMNHKELADVYGKLSEATGIASGKLVIGSKDILDLGNDVSKLGGYVSTVGGYVSTMGNASNTTKIAFDKNLYGPDGVFSNIVKTSGNVKNLTRDIGAEFDNLAAGLLNPNSQMMKDLKSLGPGIFTAIQQGAQEALDQSVLTLAVSVNAVVDKSGNGSVSWTTNWKPPTGGKTGGTDYSWQGAMPNNLGYDRYMTDRGWSLVDPKASRNVNPNARAVGGPVVGNTPYMVGERGPEMFVPKVSGTIVTTSALERYTRVRNTDRSSAASPANNIVVTVNNPVPAAAEDSITRRMKVLANSGLFG